MAGQPLLLSLHYLVVRREVTVYRLKLVPKTRFTSRCDCDWKTRQSCIVVSPPTTRPNQRAGQSITRRSSGLRSGSGDRM